MKSLNLSAIEMLSWTLNHFFSETMDTAKKTIGGIQKICYQNFCKEIH